MWHNINLNRPFWQKHFLPLNCSAFGIIMIMENLISQSVGWGEVRDEGWGWWWLDMINWHGMTPGAVIARQGTPLSRGHCPWCCDIIWHVRGTLHTPDTGWLKWSSSVHHSIHFIRLIHINCQLLVKILSLNPDFHAEGQSFLWPTQNLILSNAALFIDKATNVSMCIWWQLSLHITHEAHPLRVQ